VQNKIRSEIKKMQHATRGTQQMQNGKQ